VEGLQETDGCRVVVVQHVSRTGPRRFLSYLQTQLVLAVRVLQLRNAVDVLVFFIGGPEMLPAVAVGRLLGKRCVVSLAGTPGGEAASGIEDPPTPPPPPPPPPPPHPPPPPAATPPAVLRSVRRLTFALSHRIIAYSTRIGDSPELSNCHRKFRVAHEHFLDEEFLAAAPPVNTRGNRVGYLGRLSSEKGILQFVEAAAPVRQEMPVQFVVAGDGPLLESAKALAVDSGVTCEQLTFLGWVPRGEVRAFLQSLRLLVLPSFTEGLPNVVIEAMACGTPVLAAPVGAIPDLVKHGETGFLLPDNSATSIAEGIIEALKSPDLDRIASNGRAFVVSEFSFAAAVDGYKKALGILQNEG